MPPFLFWIFSLMMLGFAAAVVLNRNPIASALSLVLSFMGLAALFVSLDAFFIGTIQVLVYAGAVMVLFLFVIMLLDLKAEVRRKFSRFGVATGVLGVTALGALLLLAVFRSGAAHTASPHLQASTVTLGKALFSDYLLPFEIVSLILLVGMVGVILLSKREIK